MKRVLLLMLFGFSITITSQPYSNGPFSTGATTSGGATAPAGYTYSELQSVGGTTNASYGFSAYYNTALTSNFSVADDFVVPANEKWTISSIDVFGYQTGYIGTIVPIDAVKFAVYNNTPDSGTIVLGDTTTNFYNASESANSFVYRIANNSPGSTRKIWKINGTLTGDLNPGTYWLAYQVHSSNDGSIFFPGVTIPGVLAPADANAMQFTSAGTWISIINSGSLTPVAFPFIINYTVTNLGVTETRQYDSRVSVYPNPAQDFFSLKLPEESQNSKTTVTLYDASGRKVKEYNASSSYDISNLKSGVYTIKINDGVNNKVTKLIKK